MASLFETTSSDATTVVAAEPGAPVEFPDGFELVTADYGREGPDLVVVGEDGARVVVTDYFAADDPAALVSASGATVTGSVAAKLAGPMAPGQWAQAGEENVLNAIGRVETADGTVTATRLDGTKVELAKGDPIFQGDILETADGAGLGIVLADNSVFSLGEGGRMVMDEMVYDPGAQEGSATFALLTGAATFVSGQIAKLGQDAMVVKTPVATIGIRGTKVYLETDGDSIQAVNLPENTLQGETVGEIVLLDNSGNFLGSINNFGGGWQWTPSQQVTPSSFQMSETQVRSIVQEISVHLPRTLEEKALDVMDRLREVREQAREAREAGEAEKAAELEAQAEELEAQYEAALEEVETNLGYEVNLMTDEEALLEGFETAAGGEEETGLGDDGFFSVDEREDLLDLLEGAGDENDEEQNLLTQDGDNTDDDDGNGVIGEEENDPQGQGGPAGGNTSGVATLEGTVVDGYVVNADVFWDENGNGILDAGEVSTISSPFFEDLNGDGVHSYGEFVLEVPEGVPGVLTSVGGTDLSTGLPFAGTMTAPAGSTVITPLTTLVQSYAESQGVDVTTANAQVAAALGITLAAGETLMDLDPVAEAGDGNYEPLKSAAMIVNTMLQVEAVGGTDPYGALAQVVADFTPTGGEPSLDLGDAGNMGDLLGGAGVTDSGGQLGMLLAGANAYVNNLTGDADLLGNIGQANSHIQHVLVAQLGGLGGDFSGIQPFDADQVALRGTPNNDMINGTPDADELDGREGDDVIYGNGGNDELIGAWGNDTIVGGSGNDTIYGNDDDDHLQGSSGDDLIYGGDGVDTAYFDGHFGEYNVSQIVDDNGNAGFLLSHDYSEGTDEVYGVEFFAFSGFSEGEGGYEIIAADDLVGTNDLLVGGDGAQNLFGGGGDDVLFGDGTGIDLWDNDGESWIFSFGEGGTANDIDDFVGFGEGNDTLESAQDLSGLFWVFGNPSALNFEYLPHVTVYGEGDWGGDYDWYSIDVTEANTTVYFDIDDAYEDYDGEGGYGYGYDGEYGHEEYGEYTLYIQTGTSDIGDFDIESVDYTYVGDLDGDDVDFYDVFGGEGGLPQGTEFIAVIDNSTGGDYPDTMLGILDEFGGIDDYDDDSSPIGGSLGSAIAGTVGSDGDILLAVTGYDDFDFDGYSDDGEGGYGSFGEGGVDTQLALYDSNGVLLASNDDNEGTEDFPRVGYDDGYTFFLNDTNTDWGSYSEHDSWLEYTFTNPGTYYVQVGSYDDDDGEGAPDPLPSYNSYYELVVSSRVDYDDPQNQGDQLFGGDGWDLIVGGVGDDLLDGGTGTDFLYGGDGQDQLYAGDEDFDGEDFFGDGFDGQDEGFFYGEFNSLFGGADADTLVGGDYATDIFRYVYDEIESDGGDTIENFNPYEMDFIHIAVDGYVSDWSDSGTLSFTRNSGETSFTVAGRWMSVWQMTSYDTSTWVQSIFVVNAAGLPDWVSTGELFDEISDMVGGVEASDTGVFLFLAQDTAPDTAATEGQVLYAHSDGGFSSGSYSQVASVQFADGTDAHDANSMTIAIGDEGFFGVA